MCQCVMTFKVQPKMGTYHKLRRRAAAICEIDPHRCSSMVLMMSWPNTCPWERRSISSWPTWLKLGMLTCSTPGFPSPASTSIRACPVPTSVFSCHKAVALLAPGCFLIRRHVYFLAGRPARYRFVPVSVKELGTHVGHTPGATNCLSRMPRVPPENTDNSARQLGNLMLVGNCESIPHAHGFAVPLAALAMLAQHMPRLRKHHHACTSRSRMSDVTRKRSLISSNKPLSDTRTIARSGLRFPMVGTHRSFPSQVPRMEGALPRRHCVASMYLLPSCQGRFCA